MKTKKVGAKFGHEVSEKTREKIRQKLLIYFKTHDSPWKGRTPDKKTRELISKARAKQVFSKESINKRKRLDENHWGWKGDKVGYGALHTWVRKNLGTPKKCQNCMSETAKRYKWANLSKKYKRDLSDWARLCPSCHIRYDRFGLKIDIKPLLGVG